MNGKKVFGALALLLVPAIAFAHPGHDESGLVAGISHPLGGIDHLLAMIAVGLWAAQQKGAARWALPPWWLRGLLVFASPPSPGRSAAPAFSSARWRLAR